MTPIRACIPWLLAFVACSPKPSSPGEPPPGNTTTSGTGGTTGTADAGADGAPSDGASVAVCHIDGDCGAGFVCAQKQCRASGTCVNTRDCKHELVCDSTTSTCVECVRDADCGMGLRCSDAHCKPACGSDLECTKLGLLCNAGAGVCVDCLRDADCPSGRACAAGECRPKICPPNALGCDAQHQSIVHCDSSGTAFSVLNTCAASEACEDGECRAVVCEPRALACDAARIVQCNDLGTAREQVRTCGDTEYCDAAAATCRPRTCAPGELRCDGNVVVRCAADGSKNETVTDCVQQQQLCSDGQCKSPVCTPGNTVCVQEIVKRCSADGLSLVTEKTCLEEEFCSENGPTAACMKDICLPGARVCAGEVATTCNAQGGGYQPGGTNCAATPGRLCLDGLCQSLVCRPNTTFCIGPLYQCNSTGTMQTLIDNCGSRWLCDPSGASCLPKNCDQPKCDGETYQCGAAAPVACPVDQVCALGPAGCAAQARDSIPFTNEGTRYFLYTIPGIYYTVTTPRTLTEIETYLTASSQVDWVVYESADPNGTYARILDQKTMPAATTHSLVSSGPISVALKKDYHYFIGIYAATAVFQTAAQVVWPLTTSFGTARLGQTIDTGGAAAPPSVLPSTVFSSDVPAIRLTTTRAGGGDP